MKMAIPMTARVVQPKSTRELLEKVALWGSLFLTLIRILYHLDAYSSIPHYILLTDKHPYIPPPINCTELNLEFLVREIRTKEMHYR